MKAQFELKQKVVAALNKLADRDTFRLAADELHKTAETLTADAVAPFLSCVLDTDSQHKPALRRECVRLAAAVVAAHPSLAAPHLSKIVSAVLRRLRDPDSSVRDACLQAAAVFASTLGGAFVALARPLFEALGEHNKHLQSGAALCLAAVVRHSREPPPASLLHRMLGRTTKMLNNPHFLAKPALVDLNASLIQAGGAAGQNTLSAAMAAIQECLKNSDWPTRKAASTALAELALSRGSCLGSFRASIIRSLESCRFDKVKPVRDSVLHALHCWTALPGTSTPEPSETASSVKDHFCGGDYSDVTSAPGESGRKDVGFKKVGTSSTKSRIPLSVRNKRVEPQQSKEDDWHIEIAVPKTRSIGLEELNNEGSECSSVTKNFERLSTDVTSVRDIGFEYVHMDDKQDCSSVTDKFETQLVKVDHDDLEKGSVPKLLERDRQFSPEDTCSVEQIYSTKIRDRRSLDSTVTESGSPSSRGCCLQMANEVVCIRKQLLQIEDKQSNLMDLFQVFSTGIMDNLAMLQSRMMRLEDVVDRLAQNVVHREEHSILGTSRLSKQSQMMDSPSRSTCTPRPSVDLHSRKPSLLSLKTSETWGENTMERNVSNSSMKHDLDMWATAKVKMNRNPNGADIQKNARQTGYTQARNDSIFGSAHSVTARKIGFQSKHSVWKRVKGFLCEGDVDSAYVEALCCGDELILAELLDSTGPVLECLSSRNVNDVLTTLASYLLEQKFTTSVFPWLQQVVDLSSIHGPNHLVLTTKARQNLSSALKEAVNMDFSNPLEKRCISQIAVKLHHIWGNGS